MALYQVYSVMYRELRIAEDQLLSFASNKPSVWLSNNFTLEDQFFLEGWLSYVWQSWCTFCRNCVVLSVKGTITGSGQIIPSRVLGLTEEQVSGGAIQVLKGQPLNWRANSVLRFEPTWGDVDKLHDIVIGLSPSNATSILSGLATGSASAKVIQKIRNAAAHRNIQTFAEVNTLRSRYVAYSITDPMHSLFWTSTIQNEYLAIEALNDLTNAAFISIS